MNQNPQGMGRRVPPPIEIRIPTVPSGPHQAERTLLAMNRDIRDQFERSVEGFGGPVVDEWRRRFAADEAQAERALRQALGGF